MVMRSLSANTYIFTLCVIAGTFFISAMFFKEPNSDFAKSTTSVSKEMEKVTSSDLQIAFEVKTLSKESQDINSNSTDIVAKTLVKESTQEVESDTISLDEYTDLCKLVEAEAASEDIIGRQMVANVVFNRVLSPNFENNILGVIYEPGQFEPVMYNIIDSMVPTHDTREAVFAAMSGDDITGGALYFKKKDDKIWGDKRYMYRYGEHSFYQ